ncbi:MAG TPA: D-tagatose-bisphosphate aldolase, class II, non-catalytic subunit [Candidatus Sulfotelmatobacter sp.]|nr:D-tagatose-bisphosphate aldolase, class II, non-catalytic subunit [Candidatus Sulfotelmatobacter sp.]
MLTGSTGELCELLAANRRGKGRGIYSICSANRFVLEAGMLQAQRDGSLLLIESTSNQVNQFGGYTGQTPEQFAKFVENVASEMHFPKKRILLGGDHLGPHVWRKESSSEAMEKAKQMVAAYVQAGFRKIHLDTSMPCADDSVAQGQSLAEELVAARAAELCRAAEDSYGGLTGSTPAPMYVIGTEVPIPGGEQLGSQAPEVTQPKNLAITLNVSKKAFLKRRLDTAWERVIAVVVQPGVEFGDSNVFPYETKKAKALSRFLSGHWTGIYEAHSTDYQTREALRQMVLDHFAILKVGPWLTFALREAVFALAAIEKEMLSGKAGITLSGLPEVLDAAMLEHPANWKNYYHGDESALHIARKYSYSDRIRYYWPQPAVSAALQQLLHNLTTNPAPHSLLSQYLPRQASAVRFGFLLNQPGALIRDKILEVLEQYSHACGYATNH